LGRNVTCVAKNWRLTKIIRALVDNVVSLDVFWLCAIAKALLLALDWRQ
jgi:hypothetical protein